MKLSYKIYPLNLINTFVIVNTI
ncbi:MAG: hypothetical protein K0R06_627, partial [Clostridium sp.]|nr:hypothetical protein [Clostridium sp.]